MVSEASSYHHGDLRRALIEAGLGLARNGGMGGLGLREITRSVGVTPNAAYRHFADRHALVLAVAIEAQQILARHMFERMKASRSDATAQERAMQRLRGFGLGYIDFALSEPGWFELACYTQHASADDIAILAVDEHVPPPYLLLIAALDQMVAVGTLSQEQRIDAEWVCWSGVQGFTELAISGPLQGRERAVLDKLATQVVDTVIHGLVVWRRDDRKPTRACPPPDPRP
jgi:AcrR family transcriptional regulator